MNSIQSQNTWILAPLPTQRKSVKCKWVLKIKYDSAGRISKFKARLCANGVTQQKGIDYKKIFSPVAKMDSVRAIINISAFNKWDVFQDDVPTIFLKGVLKEAVWM